MEPSQIPKINRQKAALVRAELLIQAHQRQLVQYIKQLYNMDLYIHVSTSPSLNLSVRIHLQHIPTQHNQILLSVYVLEVTFWDVWRSTSIVKFWT